MRLICPSCRAEYEIPSDAIPETGRDLQCSGCGTTWFSGPAKTSQDSAKNTESTRLQSMPTNTGTDLPSLDAAVADILRQEAAGEVRRRSLDAAGGAENQKDSGLNTGNYSTTQDRHAQETRGRLERIRGVSEASTALQSGNFLSPPHETRSKGLPDVEALNSSLRATENSLRAINSKNTVPRFYQQVGFSSGFLFVISIAATLALVYSQNVAISKMAPSLEEPLGYYQITVDQARIWLDQQAEEARGLLYGLINLDADQT